MHNYIFLMFVKFKFGVLYIFTPYNGGMFQFDFSFKRMDVSFDLHCYMGMNNIAKNWVICGYQVVVFSSVFVC